MGGIDDSDLQIFVQYHDSFVQFLLRIVNYSFRLLGHESTDHICDDAGQ